MRDALINACLEGLIESGTFVEFYGAACVPVGGEFRLGLDGVLVTFLVKENPYGYHRSSMDGVYHPAEDDTTIFFATPIAQVQVIAGAPGIKRCRTQEVWHLRDRDGHVWLEWGTDNSDDWYPSFVFYYSPKAGV